MQYGTHIIVFIVRVCVLQTLTKINIFIWYNSDFELISGLQSALAPE
jgi:hypothetical protein